MLRTGDTFRIKTKKDCCGEEVGYIIYVDSANHNLFLVYNQNKRIVDAEIIPLNDFIPSCSDFSVTFQSQSYKELPTIEPTEMRDGYMLYCFPINTQIGLISIEAACKVLSLELRGEVEYVGRKYVTLTDNTSSWPQPELDKRGGFPTL